MPADSTADFRAKRARYMREYGRGKGAEPIKGERFRCEVCNKDKPKTGQRQRWCADCRAEGMRRHKELKRRAAGHGKVGATYSCENCLTEYIRVHLRQKYCLTCSALSAKDGLPKYRKRQSAYQSERNRRRRRDIPMVGICERMSSGIKNSLKSGKNGRRWEQLVGYTVKELMEHLERQFLAGMSWDNRGDWHIDHIVPISSFNFDTPDCDDFRRCWALSNLRPLWAGDNIRKNGKRTHLI